MALPGIDAERWRLVEQKLAEFSVDIQRLWRQVQQTQVGGPAQSGALTPTDLAALTASGSGGSCPNEKVVSVWGDPTAGTVTFSTSLRSNFTVNYNAATTDFDTAFSGISGVTTAGGPWPNNDITLTLPTGATLSVASFSLTRRSGGWTPNARVDSSY